NIPSELTGFNQWVLWRWVQKPDGSWTKPPYRLDGHKTKADDRDTWAPFDFTRIAFETASGNGRHFDGVGFVLSEQDPIAGFDFDHCLDANFAITDSRVVEYVAKL